MKLVVTVCEVYRIMALQYDAISFFTYVFNFFEMGVLISIGDLFMLLFGLITLMVIVVILSMLLLFGLISLGVIVVVSWIQWLLEFDISTGTVICLLVKFSWEQVIVLS